MGRNRQYVLGALLALLVVLSGIILSAVLQTVLFAVTVAYVLYPLKRWFVRRRGVSDRIGSGLATAAAFIAVAFVIGPLLYVTYQRRTQLIDALQAVPDSVSASVAGFEIIVDTEPFVDTAVDTLQDIAVEAAVSAPALALQLVLFTLVLYGLLLKPRAIRAAVVGAVPATYHDILERFHRRTKKTLFALYVLQALTAFGTFLIAIVLFWLLGYNAPLTLAAIAGILQFIPILGPSLLVIALAANDLLIGMPVRAVTVLVTGLLFISLTPDAVIRTKLAGKTGEIAPSLYFIGFVGGILTVGAIGIIIGPLVVALLVEAVKLLSEENGTLDSGVETEGASDTD